MIDIDALSIFHPRFSAPRPPDESMFTGPSTRGPHELAALGTCPTQWALRYYTRWRPLFQKDYTLIGTLFHDGAAFHHAAQQPRPPAWLNSMTWEQAVEEAGRGRPDAIRRAKDMVRFYKHFDAGRGWQPLFTEAEFFARVGNLAPWATDVADEVVTCRADLVVMINGYIYVLDHKTMDTRTDRIPPWKTGMGDYAVHWQGDLLPLIVGQSIPDIEPVALIQRVKRSEPFDIDHNPLDTTPERREDALRTLVDRVRYRKELVRRLAAGERLEKWTWNCNGKYGDCDYLQVCKARRPEDKLSILQSNFHRLEH